MEELPTLEKLKIRNPSLYHKDLLCIRCSKEKEDVKHLWECSSANNELIFIHIKCRNWLNKKLYSIKQRDDIIKDLAKYTLTTKNLKMHHNEASITPYIEKGETNFWKTFKWQEDWSLDTLLKGWIPFDMMNIFKKHKVKKLEAEKIIIEWISKINKWFKKWIWNRRCDEIIIWEEAQGIIKKDKYAKPVKEQREIREENRKKVKEKLHIDGITIYEAIRDKILLEKSNKGQSYVVLIIIYSIFRVR